MIENEHELKISQLGWFRRLTLDYERSAETAEAMVYIASKTVSNDF